MDFTLISVGLGQLCMAVVLETTKGASGGSEANNLFNEVVSVLSIKERGYSPYMVGKIIE